MKRGTPDHPKMLALAEAIKAHLDTTRPESNLPIDMCQTLACGILERLWHFTARYAPRGDVGKCRDWSLARAVGWNFDAQSLINMLVESGWVDRLSDGMTYIHDWHSHCDDGCDKYLRDNGLTYYTGQPPRRKPDKSLPRRDKSKLVKTPEPLPKPAPKPPPPPEFGAAEAAAGLVALGAESGSAKRAVEAAFRAGVSWSQVMEIVEFWKVHSHWGVGALVNRILYSTPRSEPSMGWPDQLKPGNGAPSPQKIAEDRFYAAQRVIDRCRRQKKSQEEIDSELVSAGFDLKEAYAAAPGTPNHAKHR